jgi:hypothetical protein
MIYQEWFADDGRSAHPDRFTYPPVGRIQARAATDANHSELSTTLTEMFGFEERELTSENLGDARPLRGSLPSS